MVGEWWELRKPNEPNRRPSRGAPWAKGAAKLLLARGMLLLQAADPPAG